METRIVNIKKGQNEGELDEVARMMRDGALVAFPTETVYGLGVSAEKEESVKKVFQIKGRSLFNPLALHLPSVEMIREYVRELPPAALTLMEKFLPGPLMMLLERADSLSPVVTSGSRKVGIRVPKNRVTSMLLQKAEVPVVATSANMSGRFSPVNPGHVLEALGGRIDVLVTSDDDEVLGIESTIIDLTTSPGRITRSGFITHEQISQVLGYAPLLSRENILPRYDRESIKVNIILVEGENEKVQRRMKALLEELSSDYKVGLLLTEETYGHMENPPAAKVMGSRLDLEGIAKNLFSTLRAFEKEDVTHVLVEGVSREGLGWAIMERLESSASDVIKAL
jgi:L-threonylcarbamoyladenylate synthase